MDLKQLIPASESGRYTDRDQVGPSSEFDQLAKIHKRADKTIDDAVEIADHHADLALQIRTRYQGEEAPVNVERHIQASDGARQEVRLLQGTITDNTSEVESEFKAWRAEIKAKEAKEEYYAADAASRQGDE